MHKYIILLLILLSAITSFAENATNVRVRQEGKSIIITYDLSQKSVVRLLMASSNSESYTELKAISGNVGKGVPAGENRKIVWKPLEENEKFIAQNVRFKVEAQSAYEYYTQNAKNENELKVRKTHNKCVFRTVQNRRKRKLKNGKCNNDEKDK